jgi:thiosulfate dehydrogenase [quinone] large subunit
MLLTRTKIIATTVIATLIYILLSYAVGPEPFFHALFDGIDWTGAEDAATGEYGTWLNWLGLFAIIGFGAYSVYTFGDREIEVEPEENDLSDGQVGDPVWWRAISGNTWLSVIWLPLRFVLGIHWLQAGWHKTQDIGWARSGVGPDGEMVERGQRMEGFLRGAYTPNEETGAVKAAFGWYADFLEFMVNNGWTSWFGPLVAWGEFLIGVGLLLGGLVGIAAFFGTLLNMSFLFAGTLSSNPWMFALTVFIILGWKVAGHFGLDRWLLPMLGTPWNRKRTHHVDAGPTTRQTPVSTTI